jgi:proline iminopeptidase
MSALYPPAEPHASGHLDVGDGQQVYWESLGNPDGKPALVIHGGPGSGASRNPVRSWDPERYRIIRFDQRGCGRSTPHASDPATDMTVNTTWHLVADMELLREHLGVGKWLLMGSSWGSTLLLAYAERFPERVSEIIIAAVTMTRPSEVDWLYRGARRFFPEAWERFRAGVPEAERDGNLVQAYGRLMENPDPDVRARAAQDWLTWEDAVISQEVNGKPGAYSDKVPDAKLAFVRICAHYFGHNAWLEDGRILRDAHRLHGIPGILVHGRNDLGCPVLTAWELAQAWPDARLVVIEDSGHTGSTTMTEALLAATDEFARR